MLEKTIRVRNVNAIGGRVFLHDIPRAAPQADAFALPDGVKPETAMTRQDAAGLKLDDFASLFAQVIPDKLRILDLAEKTDALAVLAIAIRQPPVARRAAERRPARKRRGHV